MSDESNDHSRMLLNRLVHAIKNDELEHVRMYVEQGVDVNKHYTGMYGEMCPLVLACRRGHEEVMEELLNAGADPNQVAQPQSRPAMLMAAGQYTLTLSMMRCLISFGADANFSDEVGRNILHFLARRQFNDTDDNILSAAKIVIENGASFYARSEYGLTPLYEACRYGNIDLVKLCIAEGADVDFDVGERTMLEEAAEGCNIDMFNIVINAGANRHLTAKALIDPCGCNDLTMIARILDTCDMDINMPIYFGGMTILHIARVATYITSETVRLLLDRGADVRTVSGPGFTALYYTAIYCCSSKMRPLLSCNHPLNIKNNKNETPLVKLTHDLINRYSRSRQQAHAHNQRVQGALYQAGVLAFKMLVTAGAKITADVEHKLNQLQFKYPEAQLPDYEIRSTRSLKDL